MAGSEGRLYRTGDLSTDNLTAIGPAVNEWAPEDDDSYGLNDQLEVSRVSVVKFREEPETEDGKEVSFSITFHICSWLNIYFILFLRRLILTGRE